VVQRPPGFNQFEFVVLSGLRAAQLMRGCTPRVASAHKVITTAQMEVAEWKVVRAPLVPVVPPARPALAEDKEDKEDKEEVGSLT
jgi:DNA-directed RNA polymerase subunit K/omega